MIKQRFRSTAGLLAILAIASAAVAQQPVDEALATAYERLKADPNLQDEQARHRMLMEMADHYSQFAEAAFQATDDLQSYAAKVRATGLMFRTRFERVRQFDKGLRRLTEHPAFKSFQKYAAIRGQAGTVVGLRDRLSATMNNPNLPPGARNSLTALQSLGAGLEQLGNIPLAGPMLEGYGQILSGLTDVMNNLAGRATATVKEGVFSAAEEQTALKGLDRTHQYVKTPLWHRGIPLVQEYPFATGEERYYLQMPSGTWVGITDYDGLAEIAADHYLVKKKNPDAATLWRIFNDPEEQDSLRFRAELELGWRHTREEFGTSNYKQVSETRERIRDWHQALGLPLEYAAMNRLIHIELANPGSVERTVRARVVRAYPGFAAYLASVNEDPQSLDISAMIERFAGYQKGEWLAAPASDDLDWRGEHMAGVKFPREYWPADFEPSEGWQPPYFVTLARIPYPEDRRPSQWTAGVSPMLYESAEYAHGIVMHMRKSLADSTSRKIDLGDEAYIVSSTGRGGAPDLQADHHITRRIAVRIGRLYTLMDVTGNRIRGTGKNAGRILAETPTDAEVLDVARQWVGAMKRWAHDRGIDLYDPDRGISRDQPIPKATPSAR